MDGCSRRKFAEDLYDALRLGQRGKGSVLLQSWQEIMGTAPGGTKGEGEICIQPTQYPGRGALWICMGCLLELRSRGKHRVGGERIVVEDLLDPQEIGVERQGRL